MKAPAAHPAHPGTLRGGHGAQALGKAAEAKATKTPDEGGDAAFAGVLGALLPDEPAAARAPAADATPTALPDAKPPLDAADAAAAFLRPAPAEAPPVPAALLATPAVLPGPVPTPEPAKPVAQPAAPPVSGMTARTLPLPADLHAGGAANAAPGAPATPDATPARPGADRPLQALLERGMPAPDAPTPAVAAPISPPGAFPALLEAVAPTGHDRHARDLDTATGAAAAVAALGNPPPSPLPPPADFATPATTVHTAALPSQPLDAAFAGDVGVEVRWMIDAGLQQAELHLHPADLGPIQVQLNLQAQTADLQFTAQHATTREGLRQALPELREMLAGQGLQLGQAGVSAGGPGERGAGQPRREASSVPPLARAAGGVAAAGAVRTTGRTVLRGGLGMLDLYA